MATQTPVSIPNQFPAQAMAAASPAGTSPAARSLPGSLQPGSSGAPNVGLSSSQSGLVAPASSKGTGNGNADGDNFLQLSSAMARLPVGVSVNVPVRDFRVRNLLAMEAGAVIKTQWGHGEDLPITSGDVQLAWSELEVVDSRLAVRVTRLA